MTPSHHIAFPQHYARPRVRVNPGLASRRYSYPSKPEPAQSKNAQQITTGAQNGEARLDLLSHENES
jgi:hypothetical protein